MDRVRRHIADDASCSLCGAVQEIDIMCLGTVVLHRKYG